MAGIHGVDSARERSVLEIRNYGRPTLCGASVAPITATFLGLKKASSVRRRPVFRILSLSIQVRSGIDQFIACANGLRETQRDIEPDFSEVVILNLSQCLCQRIVAKDAHDPV